ncbi:glycosyltransferase family 4 protein [Pelagicoccus sp. SDUM812003]|uniref:glycosyltransferase family 4 protein n=1 Tax=Pelagicoccus sp. SDUM812003 TaxID=3041267 RepID=UPI00280E0AC7|nr:glycosyltransferase family 4 protein [Pelagicoccus sp. SDUM812003]MDQ8205626.1 glycosyltransferase family 4 protein [Pelagicoccus sp. SDUM812003]
MKILNIVPDLSSGGAEKLVAELNQQFVIRKHKSITLTLCNNKNDSTQSLNHKKPYDALKAPHRLISWYLKNGPFEIVHLHLTPAQLLAPYIKLIDPQAILVTTEHSTTNRRRQLRFGTLLDAVLYFQFSKVVCISQGSRQFLTKDRPYLKQKTSVILNGIDSSRFRRSEVEQDPTLILSVGRLVHAKNFHSAILALKNIRDLNFKYLIAGTGPEQQKLQDLIINSRLEDKVKLVGHIQNIPRFLSKGSIFLTPSNSEGFGLAAAEAMASGLAIIGSNVPGLREVIGEDNESCLLSNPTDLDKMSSNLRAVLMNSALRERLQSNALKRSKKFSILDSSDRHLCLYNHLNSPEII